MLATVTPVTGRAFEAAIGVSAAGLAVVTSAGVVAVAATNAFGATRQTDAYVFALALPLFVVAVVALAPSVAAIPIIARAAQRGENLEAQELSDALLWIVIFTSLSCSILLLIARTPIIDAVAVGFDGATRALVSELLPLTVLGALFLAISNALTANLNAHQRFAFAAAAPAIVSAITTATIISFHDHGVVAWAWGYLCGNVVAGSVLLFRAGVAGLLPSVVRIPRPEIVRDLATVVTPFAAVVLVTQLVGLVVRGFSSTLPAGVLTALGIALTVANIPLGLSAHALGTTLIPAFTQGLRFDPAAAVLFRQAVLVLNVLLAPIAFTFVLLPEPIVRALFERGSFGPEATRITAEALRIYALGLLVQPFFVVAHRALLAARRTGLLLSAGLVEQTALVGLTVILIRPLGHVGVALAATLAVGISAVLLVILARGSLGSRDVGSSVRLALVIDAMALAGSAIALPALSLFVPTTAWLELPRVAAACALGAATYGALLWVVPSPALAELRHAVAAYLRRSRP